MYIINEIENKESKYSMVLTKICKHYKLNRNTITKYLKVYGIYRDCNIEIKKANKI